MNVKRMSLNSNRKQNADQSLITVHYFQRYNGLKRTWHVTLCFPTLDPFATLVPPVVLIGQNHVHVDVIVRSRVQKADVETQKGKHPPGKEKKAFNH